MADCAGAVAGFGHLDTCLNLSADKEPVPVPHGPNIEISATNVSLSSYVGCLAAGDRSFRRERPRSRPFWVTGGALPTACCRGGLLRYR